MLITKSPLKLTYLREQVQSSYIQMIRLFSLDNRLNNIITTDKRLQEDVYI